MNNLKSYIAVIISILINFGVFYQLGQKHNNWQLTPSDLQSGANANGRIENLNIVSQATKAVTAKPTPLEEKVSKNTINKAKKSIVTSETHESLATKTVENTQSEKQATKENIPEDSGKSSPQIVAHKAQLVSAPPPLVYPAEAIKQNAIGKVSIRAQIDSDGKISKIDIIKSSGYKVLDEAAIQWFRQLSFKPAHNGNSTINSFVSQTITFDLNEHDV